MSQCQNRAAEAAPRAANDSQPHDSCPKRPTRLPAAELRPDPLVRVPRSLFDSPDDDPSLIAPTHG